MTITITDEHTNSLSLKMDIGVHKDLDIEQDEYSFDIGIQEDAVSLLINSPAQMITEKLKSLLRFLSRSTRYRDVFDICYLSERADKEKLLYCMEKYIFEDKTLSVNNMTDVTMRLEQVFGSKSFVQSVSRSRRNWLDIPAEEALASNLEFFRSLSE